MEYLYHLGRAFRRVITSPSALILLIALWGGLLVGIMLIPVRLIPGNDFGFQAKLFSPADYARLVSLTFLMAFVLTLQIAIWTRARRFFAGAGTAGSAGIASGLISFIFASASCALCLGGALSFLGAGALLFLSEYSLYFFSAGLGLLVLSAFVSAKRFNGVC